MSKIILINYHVNEALTIFQNLELVPFLSGKLINFPSDTWDFLLIKILQGTLFLTTGKTIFFAPLRAVENMALQIESKVIILTSKAISGLTVHPSFHSLLLLGLLSQYII